MPSASSSKSATRSTVEAEREPGSELALGLLDEVLDALPGPISAIVRCGTGSANASPYGGNCGKPGVCLGEQRDEPLVRLGREPDVRVEPFHPRELGGERRERREMLGNLG